jgi:GxxExxY protein
MELNEITDKVIGCAIRVHEALGPGLLESTYEICLAHELHKAGLSVQCQIKLPVTYDSIKLDAGYRIDMLVEDTVILEIKAVDRLLPIHEAQLLSYLKLSDKKLGLILNFNVRLMKDGIRRLAN